MSEPWLGGVGGLQVAPELQPWYPTTVDKLSPGQVRVDPYGLCYLVLGSVGKGRWMVLPFFDPVPHVFHVWWETDCEGDVVLMNSPPPYHDR